MPLRYKVDVLGKLKEAGYTTYKLKKDKLLGEATIQNLREGKPVSWASIESLCRLLSCQPGDLIEFNEEDT